MEKIGLESLIISRFYKNILLLNNERKILSLN